MFWTPPIGYTYIFELIGPSNRIVVDYKEDSLVLLAIIRTETGEDISIEMFEDDFNIPTTYAYHKVPLEELIEHVLDDMEGFVIKFDNGERIKIKGENYLRLHKIITNTSSRDIWKLLRDNEAVMEYVENMPDEFYDWFRMTVGTLFLEYRAIKQQVLRDWNYGEEKGYYLIEQGVGWMPNGYEDISRKDVAKYFQTCQYPKLMFALLDGRDIEKGIWNLIEPKYEKAFML
jgi:RNA ligase